MMTGAMGDVGSVEIVVRGEAERRVPPSRAVIALTVHAVAPDVAVAAARAAEATSRVRTEFEGLPAAVRGHWSIGTVATYVDRPWTETGRGAPEHHATASVRLELLDLAFVGPLVDAWAARADLELGGVAWDVAPAEWAEAERQARAEAVAVAARRARDLGEAIGRTVIQVQKLVDLDGHGGPTPMFARAADAGLGSSLVPADVVVAVSLEAHVTAR